MKQDIEVASRIEREKVIQELHVAYKIHKDQKHYIISSAAIQKYAVPLFKAGAEWQANQPLSQEQIDIKLSEYINSSKTEDKLQFGLFSLITISSMAIDANSAKTTLSTEFTHKGKRYKAEMLITQKEV